MEMEIVINDSGIPHGILQIVKQLPDPASVEPSSRITLCFRGDPYVHLTDLVLLASWRKSLPAGIEVYLNDEACSKGTQSLFANTGFREIIDTGHEIPSAHRRIGRVPLQPITNQFSKEATVSDIAEIFDVYAGHVKDSNPFKVLISELCENVLAHSELISPGYTCARVIESTEKAEITIADTGVGIRQSYMSGTNESIKERIRKGASPLDLALEGLNSSKPTPPVGNLRSYYGFGLFITRRLVEENRGQLFLMSGNEALHLHRYDRDQSKLPKPYNGTFIGIIIDLNNPLPLDEIYADVEEKYVGPEVQTTNASVGAKSTHNEYDTDDKSSSGIRKEQEIPPKEIELRHYGTELLTRDAGTAIRADIAGYLAAGYMVKVSLDDVHDITPSVADEAFAKLAQTIGQELFKKRVRFVGGTQLANRLIEFVLKTRQNNPLKS